MEEAIQLRRVPRVGRPAAQAGTSGPSGSGPHRSPVPLTARRHPPRANANSWFPESCAVPLRPGYPLAVAVATHGWAAGGHVGDRSRAGSERVHDKCGGGRDDCDAGAADAGAGDLLRVLQLLAEAGCRLEGLSTSALQQVVRHGDVELAQWVVQQAGGGRWPQNAMRCILEDWPEGGAPGSRLCDAVRMVLEAGGSPGSCREVQQAARRGDLEALRLLHGQGRLRLGREVWAAAAESGCEAVLEWLAAEGCLRIGTDVGQDPYLAAGLREDRGTLCALRRLGVPWAHRGVLRAAVNRVVAPLVVRWMVEEGAPWDGAAVAEAAEEARRLGHEATAAWLEQQMAARGGRGAGGEGAVGGKGRGGKRRR